MRSRRYCEVSNNTYTCEAPPAFRIGVGGVAIGDRSCRGTCFLCGQACCNECSDVRNVDGKKRRVCEDCKGESA